MNATSVHFESPANVTIEGETWQSVLTAGEYAAWDQYATDHPYLLSQSYGRTLEMFLNHLRRGIDLNAVAKGARP